MSKTIIKNIYNGNIGQKIEHVDTIHFHMDGDGQFHFGEVGSTRRLGGYSDEQIARALEAIIEKKVLDQKKKWTGALWALRWVANFPADAQGFSKRVKTLPMKKDLFPPCDYNNIRDTATLSFLNYDPRQMESVVVSKGDSGDFQKLKVVAAALIQELG